MYIVSFQVTRRMIVASAESEEAENPWEQKVNMSSEKIIKNFSLALKLIHSSNHAY